MGKIIDDNFLSSLELVTLVIKEANGGNPGGNRLTTVYGSSTEFADFREYFPGDDIRRIDWNIFARFGKLFVKQFYDERQLHVKIYIDTSYSMAQGDPLKSELALKVAAGIGYLAVAAMDKVSFILLKGNENELLCPSIVGKDAFLANVQSLNDVVFDGDTNLEASIKYGGDPGYGNGLSVIISDFLTDSDWKGAVDYLKYNKREVDLIQVLSPDEMSPLSSGRLSLLDSEAVKEDDKRHTRMVINRSALIAYEKAVKWMYADMKNFAASRGIRFMRTVSDMAPEKVMLQQATEAEILR